MQNDVFFRVKYQKNALFCTFLHFFLTKCVVYKKNVLPLHPISKVRCGICLSSLHK